MKALAVVGILFVAAAALGSRAAATPDQAAPRATQARPAVTTTKPAPVTHAPATSAKPKPAPKPRSGWHVYAIGEDSTRPLSTYYVTCLPDGADEGHPDTSKFREVAITHAQYKTYVANPSTSSIPCPG